MTDSRQRRRGAWLLAGFLAFTLAWWILLFVILDASGWS